MSMLGNMDKICSVELSKSLKLQASKHANDSETRAYRRLAGTLLYLGQPVLPQACAVASRIQQCLGSSKVLDEIEANTIVYELGSLEQTIGFRAPQDIRNVKIVTLSDSSHSGRIDTCGQSRIINRLNFDSAELFAYINIMVFK